MPKWITFVVIRKADGAIVNEVAGPEDLPPDLGETYEVRKKREGDAVLVPTGAEADHD